MVRSGKGVEQAAVHQLVHTLSYGDAISGEVFALQRCLRKEGREAEIYAINIHPKYKNLAKDYRELSVDFPGEAVLHYSLGSPLNGFFHKLERARRTLIYHNLTPPDWFAGVNPRIVADIRRGMRELPDLCALCARLIADSGFNAEELRELGFDAEVLELPLDPERWNVAANSGIAHLIAAEPSVHLLHVGRFAPNKCIEDIIKIFYFFHHHVKRESRLWLVGIDIDTELYSFSLKRLAYELRVDHAVNFVGCLADAELKALYQGASIYLCMSEHEGFCLPLVEAMHFGVPVIAYAAAAVPDTLSSGGVLVLAKRHAEIAELIGRVSSDERLRTALIQAGRSRAADLSFARFARRVGEIWRTTPAAHGSESAA